MTGFNRVAKLNKLAVQFPGITEILFPTVENGTYTNEFIKSKCEVTGPDASSENVQIVRDCLMRFIDELPNCKNA